MIKQVKGFWNVSSDLETLEMDLFTQFIQDGKLIEDLTGKFREMQNSNFASTLGFADPPEFKGLVDKAKTLWEMRHMMKFFKGEYAEPMNKYAASAKEPILRDVLQNLFLESSPLWFVAMTLLLAAIASCRPLISGLGGVITVNPLRLSE